MTTTYLLDTQIALWIFTNSDRINPSAFNERFAAGEFVFHQVSTWEIQIKHSLGKLPLPSHPKTFLPKLIEGSGMRYSNIEDKAIFSLDKLPSIHRDPFDRLLIAHALVNGWTIISADRTFEQYPILLEPI